MRLDYLLFLIVCMRMGRKSKAAVPNLLRPGSPDTMATRERVRELLHNRKPTFVEGRGQHLSKSAIDLAKTHKKYYLGPKNPLAETPLYELNKNVESYMLEGDMLLGEEHAKGLMDSLKVKRMVTTNSDLYWDPAVTINYTIDSTLKGSDRTAVLKGVKFWMENSCLKFEENAKGDHRLYFFKGDGCYSYVGKSKYNSQEISIGQGCTSLGTVTHEMSHALGFYHTQSSYDRDDFIFINFSNIELSKQYNFAKFSIKAEKNLPSGMDYDMASVMQYNPYAFAINSKYPTVVALNPLMGGLMGQRVAPVFSDVRMMNLLYNCSAHCDPAPSCQNHGYPDPHDCSRCKCPAAFGGPLCSVVTNGTAAHCNGQIMEATHKWQNYTAIAGDPSSWKVWSNISECFWVIQVSRLWVLEATSYCRSREGPQCSQLEIEITSLTSVCYQQCPYQGMEMNPGAIDLGGMLMCCDSVVNETFSSSSNIITMRGVVRYNQISFGFRYRIKQGTYEKNCVPTTEPTTTDTTTTLIYETTDSSVSTEEVTTEDTVTPVAVETTGAPQDITTVATQQTLASSEGLSTPLIIRTT